MNDGSGIWIVQPIGLVRPTQAAPGLAGCAFACPWIYNARMEQPADSPALGLSLLPPGSRRRSLWVAGGLAALAGALLGGPHGASLLQAVRDFWLHTLLPAFHSLHISGLQFCS